MMRLTAACVATLVLAAADLPLTLDARGKVEAYRKLVAPYDPHLSLPDDATSAEE